MLAGNAVGNFSNKEISSVRKRAEADTSEAEVFHYKVLQLIKLFYKVLIGATILFMGFHQWLDFLRTKRRQKQNKKS
jgi:hypothetical protein